MRRWKTAAGIVIAAAVLAIAVVFSERTGGLTLVIYVFVLGGIVLILLLSRLAETMPRAHELGRFLPRAKHAIDEVEQFRIIARQLTLSSSSELDLHYHLRPLIKEIASARLARRHGIDLEHEPERAHAQMGAGRVWELVRPDREPPEDRAARGWSKADLERLLHELEGL
ncbi:MAG: hypothetical protein JXA57_16950 [Armatimonadetes bacterium]|nr:hypothetical protein [Armatimonadota bacterium]